METSSHGSQALPGILRRESSASRHGRRKLSFDEATPKPMPLRAEGWKAAKEASERVGNIEMASFMIAEDAQKGLEGAKSCYIAAQKALKAAKQDCKAKEQEYDRAEHEWILARTEEEETTKAIEAFSHKGHAPYARQCAMGASKLMNKLVLCDLEPEIKEKLQDHTLKIIENSHTFDSFDRNIMMIATKTMRAAIEKKESDPEWDIDDFISKKAPIFESLEHIVPISQEENNRKEKARKEKSAKAVVRQPQAQENPFKVIFDLLSGKCGHQKPAKKSKPPLSSQERLSKIAEGRKEHYRDKAKQLKDDILSIAFLGDTRTDMQDEDRLILSEQTKNAIIPHIMTLYTQNVEGEQDKLETALSEIAIDTLYIALKKKREDPQWDIDSFLKERSFESE